MHTSFNLTWDELPEELRDQKIDAYITANESDYKTTYAREFLLGDIDSPSDDQIEEAASQAKLKDLLGEQMLRDEAADCISAHFPIYF